MFSNYEGISKSFLYIIVPISYKFNPTDAPNFKVLTAAL